MDVALTVVDALRQIYTLRKAILRQRRVNEGTYLQMMEIFVELHSSEGVQVNATLRRTAAVEKFSEAVIRFSSYLQKYDHMCRVVRLFKLAAMEEERLEIVGEIDQVLRMLNLASAVTVMNGAVAASRNAARIRAKLEEMHGDIKLGHDQLLAALLAKKQQADMAKKQQHADQGPVLEERSCNRVGVDRVLVHQVSVLTASEGYEQANLPLQAFGDTAMAAVNSSTDTMERKSLIGDNSVGDIESSASSDEDQETSPQVEPNTLDIVAGTKSLVVEKGDLGDLKPTVVTGDGEGKEPSSPQFTLIEELEKEPIGQQPALVQRTADNEVDEDGEEQNESHEHEPLWTLDSSDELDEQPERDSSDRQLADEGEVNGTTPAVEYVADALVEPMKANDDERHQQSDEMSRQLKSQLSASMLCTTDQDEGLVEGESSEDQSALTQGITNEGAGGENALHAEQLESMRGSVDDVVDEPSSNQPREVVEDTEKDESSSQHSTQSSDVSDGLDLENEALPLEENDSVPLLVKLLGAIDTTAQEKEDTVLNLLRTCVTNSSRVEVYKTKGIPVLTNLVRHGETFLTQLYALHCLSWFTFSFSKLRESDFMELNNCVREPSHEDMLSLLHDLQSDDDEVKERAALQSSCMATSGAGDALRQLGVLPLLIEELKDGTDNQKLWAAEALVTLASDSDENCVAIVRGGAIPPLVLLLRSGTDMHKQEAAYALGNLAANNEVNRAKIAREGAIPPMVEFVKSVTDAQNQWAVYALGSLSLNNEENRVLIAEEGAIRPLVKLLRVGTRAQKQWAAYTLGNLAHNDANRVEITLHGAIVPLVQLLQTGTAMQKQRAAFALGNLACDNDTTDFDEAILPLVNLVRTGSDSQKEDAAYTLGNLAANNGARRAEIGRAGAIAPLVKLLKIGDGEQKQWAAFALRCLAYDNHLNRMAIVKEGAIDALAAIVEEGTTAQKEEATHALEHLAVKDDAAAATFIPDRVMAPLMDTISLNANVAAAAALNTLETVREGVLPLFRKLMKPEAAVKTESASQNLGCDGPKDATDVRVVAGAW